MFGRFIFHPVRIVTYGKPVTCARKIRVVGDQTPLARIVSGRRILLGVREQIMMVKVKVFASLRKYIPELDLGENLDVTMESGSSIAQLYEKLGIPEDEVKLAFVNGQYRKSDYVLSDEDEIGIFPLLVEANGYEN